MYYTREKLLDGFRGRMRDFKQSAEISSEPFVGAIPGIPFLFIDRHKRRKAALEFILADGEEIVRIVTTSAKITDEVLSDIREKIDSLCAKCKDTLGWGNYQIGHLKSALSYVMDIEEMDRKMDRTLVEKVVDEFHLACRVLRAEFFPIKVHPPAQGQGGFVELVGRQRSEQEQSTRSGPNQ